MSGSDAKEPKAAAKPEVIFNTKRRFVQKRNYRDPGGWLHSPAMFELFRASEWRLLEVAEERRLDLGEVRKVRLARIKGEKQIYIVPAENEDPDGIPITRYKDKAMINMVDFLSDDNLTVAPGYKERFDLVPAGAESPVGAALKLDLTKPLDHRPDGRRTKKTAQKPATGKSTPATAPAGEAPAGKAETEPQQ